MPLLQAVEASLPLVLSSAGPTKIAVAFSGGADSLALLVALAYLRESRDIELTALHCNFGLRGEESDADELFCRQQAKNLKVRLNVMRFFEVRRRAAEQGKSLEMICRELRYEWFDGFLRRGYVIAVAHHREDNRETMMLNLLRTTGLRGLCGMDTLRDGIWRPLLPVSRREIETFLNARDLEWRTDSTNLIDDVQRNRLRLNILPAIDKNFPEGLNGIDRTMSHLRDDYSFFRKAMEKVLGRAVSSDSLRKRIDITVLLEEYADSASRILFEALKADGFSYDQCIDMAGIDPQTGYRRFDSRRCVAFVNSDEALVMPRKQFDGLTGDGPLYAPDLATLAETVPGLSLRTVRTDNPLSYIKEAILMPEYQGVAFFDADIIDEHCRTFGGFTWRTLSDADRMRPYGMGGKTKLLSDILSNLHASPIDKAGARVLTDGKGRILWLAPFRSSAFYPVTESTRRIVILRYSPQTYLQ